MLEREREARSLVSTGYPQEGRTLPACYANDIVNGRWDGRRWDRRRDGTLHRMGLWGMGEEMVEKPPRRKGGDAEYW